MSNFVLPGDKIAITEEYESGKNACDDGHIVRSTVIGENQIDKKDRLVHVKNHKSISCLLYTSPSPRDYAASRMPSSA